MDKFSPQSKWSELPLDILMRLTKLITDSTNIITYSFSFKLQILQFRAVFKSWRSALPLKNKYHKYSVSCNIPIPISVAPRPALFPSSGRGSSRFCELSREVNGSFYLVPTTACILRLFTTLDRSSSWDIKSSKSINLLDYRVSVVAEEYCLRFLINDNGLLRLQDSHENLCKKAILVRNLKSDEELDGVAIVLFDNAVLAEYSFTEKEWNVLYDGKKSKCSDIIRYEDGCIVLDHKGNAFRVAYDFHSRTLGWTHIAGQIRGCRTRRRLVVSSKTGGLYLVVQNTFLEDFQKFKVSFSLYLFSEELYRWKRLQVIPMLILCVGIDFSFSVNGKDFPTISCGIGNCIFSTIGSFKMYEGVGNSDRFFDYIHDNRCVFHLANDIKKFYTWRDDDYCPMLCSPSKWLDLNPHLLLSVWPPRWSIEQPAVPVEKKSYQNPGGHSSLAGEDENVGSKPRELGDHDDLQGNNGGKRKGRRR